MKKERKYKKKNLEREINYYMKVYPGSKKLKELNKKYNELLAESKIL